MFIAAAGGRRHELLKGPSYLALSFACLLAVAGVIRGQANRLNKIKYKPEAIKRKKNQQSSCLAAGC